MKTYDGADTFFYLDPTYFGYEEIYGKGLFGREEYGELAFTLKKLKGKFLLSINDVPPAYEVFHGLDFYQVKAFYATSVIYGQGKQPRELLIANYKIPQVTLEKHEIESLGS